MPKLKTEKLKRADGTEVDALPLDAAGKFTYIDDSGAEKPGDFLETLGKLKAAAGERETLVSRATAAESDLAKWVALGKLDEVSAGLETVKALKAGDLTRAEDVQRLRAETKKQTEEALAAQIQAADAKVKAMQERLDQSELLQLLQTGAGATKPLADGKQARVFADAVDGQVLHRFLGDRFKKNDKGEWVAYDDPADARSMIVDPESLMPLKGAAAVQALVERNPSAKAILYNRPQGSGSGHGNNGGGGAADASKSDNPAQLIATGLGIGIGAA